MRDPFKVPAPFYLSFSGGRTSGYLLRRVLDAHGGTLPDGGHVLFANTGKEHSATLDFVAEVGKRWCPVTWIEYRREKPRFATVTYETANRIGDPFKELILSKQRLPSPPMRFCTSELKVKPMEAYLQSIGLQEFTAILGIRADEPRRVSRIRGQVDRDIALPLADAGITEDEVLEFWGQSDFDLPWPHDQKYFGNCDLCFLKSTSRLQYVIESRPDLAAWWIEMEELMGHQFRFDRPSIKQMVTQITVQGKLFECAVDDSMPCDCTE
jgi:3'-phosphoadenosine 5'-phosphosulfate sulfotransferase (PAPS reductase)/FAD synthetase